METSKIYQGDCLEVLKTFPDKSIDCCVTSPPYYGLRDYGTGKWIGGDPNCPHRRMSKYSENTITGHKQIELVANVGDAIYKTVCPLCGAIREDKQIGLEETPEEYINKLVKVFREVKRCLKDDGTLWVNIGDSYAGTGDKGNTKDPKNPQGRNGQSIAVNRVVEGVKQKDLIGIPWMLAFALRADGWYLRQDIIWSKPNPMPEPVKDRCTKSHEYIFLLSKSSHYYFNHDAIQEKALYADDRRANKGRIEYSGKRADGDDDKAQQSFVSITETRNKRDVWSVTPKAVKDAHFATYPEELIEPCILAGSEVGGVILDPFFGSGTTGRVAERLGRKWVGIELNPKYIEIAERRTNNVQIDLFCA